MPLNRAEKQKVIDTYSEKFSKASLAIITEYRGLTVEEMTKVRTKLRETNSEYHVIKNTLAKKALEGTNYELMKDKLVGPTAVVFAFADPIESAKALYANLKDFKKLRIVGGQLGTQVLNETQVENLSKLPSLNEIRAQLLGVVTAPFQKLLAQILAPAQQLTGVIQAKIDKEKEESGTTEE